MAILEGKGMYLWRISNAEDGDAEAIGRVAEAAGLTHVLIKVADGTYGYNYESDRVTDRVPAVVEALREKGVSPWGWQYIYGNNPRKEAEKGIERVEELGLDGFVVNAEKEFKFTSMRPVAELYMQVLRAGLPNTPIGFSTYRYPSYHRPLPFETFLEYSDINMPQVYWVQANNPAWQLEKSMREYEALSVVRPFFPTGAAYSEHGWAATPSQVQRFMQAVIDFGLPGCNFWAWYWARLQLLNLWPTIASFQMGPVNPDPPAGDPPEVDLEALQRMLKRRGLPVPK